MQRWEESVDALHYLRRQAKKRQIWIDALCINQKDIPERNRQLRIMHHIYFRAAVVIVWLGAGYSRYHDIMQHMQSREIQAYQERVPTGTNTPPTPGLKKEGADAADISQEEVGMVEELYNDEYWRRLWIVQEIGQADHLQVCFGRSAPLTWEAFIHLIRMHNKGTEGPIKLDQLRQSRSTGGFKLRNLLLHHRQTNCKEPRHKVYGLIGLADDAHRFPMNYAKTLIEAWTDVMHFTWQRGLLPSSEIITFGALVKFLLMGNQCTPLQQALRPHGAEQDPVLQRPDSNTPVVFEICGAVLGAVGFVGASTTDIVRKLNTVDEWNERVQEAYSEDIESAGLESRTLIRSLLAPDQTKRCFNHYKQEENDTILVEGDKVDDDPHLFQFQNRRGDLLVWISNIPAVILLRPTFIDAQHVELRIHGTAWVTDDVARKRTSHSDRMDAFRNSAYTATIKMDATTVFVLLAHLDDYDAKLLE
ncbi:heterokaryon incompatibility [Apiospora saccharicola]